MTSRRFRLALCTTLALACCSGVAVAGRGGFGGFRGGGGGFRNGGFGGYRGGFGGAGGGFRDGNFGRAAGYRGSGFGGAAGYRGANFEGARCGGFEGARGAGGMSSFNRTPSFGTSRDYGGYGGLRRAGGMNPYSGGAAVGRGAVGVAGERGGFVAGTGGALAGRAYGGPGAWGWRNPAYAGYHSGWVHGYWAGHYGGWGWGWGGYGAGLATGLAAWGLGSALYSGGWGYMPYYNPYYDGGAANAQAAGYNYAQPIDTTSAPPPASVTDPALSAFDLARSAFKSGAYGQALAQADQALKAMPDDTAIHEFRALTLFALGRLDDAAAALYGVLSVGPGWDWTTLIGLYPDVETFTAQLRALEQYTRSHPDSASAHFVQAYLYLTEGENVAASGQLKMVTKLQPKDRVSAQLLQSITKAKAAEDTIDSKAPESSEPAKEGHLAGSWTASQDKASTIRLTVAADGAFTWKVTVNSQSHELAGKSTYGSRVLTLVQGEDKPPLVGEVNWQDDDHFTLHALGGGPGDPGLSFRSSR